MADVVKVRLEVFGDTIVDRVLVRFGERGADLRPVLTALRDDFYEIETKQFETEGEYGSGGWRPLSPVTVALKARHKPPLDPRILHATLAMRRSLTRRNARGSRSRVTKDSLRVWSDVRSPKGFPYPIVHQQGSRDGRIPRRPPVQFPERDKKRWAKALQRYIVTGSVDLSGK